LEKLKSHNLPKEKYEKEESKGLELIDIYFDSFGELIKIPFSVEGNFHAELDDFGLNGKIDKIEQVSENEFLTSEILKRATARSLEIIGEAVKTLSAGIKNKNPDVLIFVSMDRGGDLKNDDTKTKLYKYALAKNIPSGYKLETDLKLFDGYDLEGMILYKANLWEVRFEKRFTALKNG
jgi:hypothetical protein